MTSSAPGPAGHRDHLRHRLASASSIGDLFAHAFRFAAEHLDGEDVATLLRTTPGGAMTLAWTTPQRCIAAEAHADALALRGPRHRLRLRSPERLHLLDLLDDGATDPARLAFLVAAITDARFSSVEPRVTANDKRASAIPRAFFDDVKNPPPPLGQMTPVAACRRWMRGFWYVGRVQSIEGFGPIPAPRFRHLPSRTQQALQGAVDAGELRLASASWKPHLLTDLVALPSRSGCFAFGACHPEPTDAEIDSVLRTIRSARPHVVLFPELAFSDAAFDRLRAWLRTNAGRFPALVVVGRAHRPKAGGGHENLGVVLDGSGEVLLEHEKLEPYQLPNGRMEDLLPRARDRYEVLDTPVGRLVVNVCKDVRSDVPMLLNRMLGVSLLLVPAYSPRLEFVLEEARVLGARQKAIVLATNAATANPEKPEDFVHSAAIYVPLLGSGSSRTVDGPGQGAGTVHTFTLRVGAESRGVVDASPAVAV